MQTVTLGEFLRKIDVPKHTHRNIILVNGVRKGSLNQILECNDVIEILPILRGG